MNITATVDIRKKEKKGIDRANDTTGKMIFAMLEIQEQDGERAAISEKEQILKGIKQAVKEVKLVKAGKLKPRLLKDVLNEI